MRIAVIAAAAWLGLMTAAPGQELRTLKERLSDKASDAQRVDNCRVPVDRRGPVPRPDCPPKTPPSSVLGAKSPSAAR